MLIKNTALRTEERKHSRNGYRECRWDTRVGSLELQIPKLRSGSYFSYWLLNRRTRSEKALISVVTKSYLLGVSTPRVENLLYTLGITNMSKSEVSDMAVSLDKDVAAFRSRPLDGGPYTVVIADATVMKVLEDHRTVGIHVLHAIGVNAEGKREILGC
ncbi:MAG: transposase, partial [Candidatus Dormibacteria bacterium]